MIIEPFSPSTASFRYVVATYQKYKLQFNYLKLAFADCFPGINDGSAFNLHCDHAQVDQYSRSRNTKGELTSSTFQIREEAERFVA